jgi:hypothetical protein
MEFLNDERKIQIVENETSLLVSDEQGRPLFSLYNMGGGYGIRLKLDYAKLLTYAGCADGNGPEFVFGK